MLRFSSNDTIFKFGSLEFKNDAALDTVLELEEAIDDLDSALDGSSSGFDDKIKQKLLAQSNSKNYDEAKKEWSLKKQWADVSGKCELCGHNPIVYHFQIENKLNNNLLILGSECILNYVHLTGFTKEELKQYLTRLRQRLHDKRFNAVDNETLDIWDKQDAIFASTKAMLTKLPNDFDILEFKNQLDKFRRISGVQIASDFELYIRNIKVLCKVMETTYKTTKIHEMPDKIKRKQKKNTEKLTDKEKLQMFIEFETQLSLLFKYSSPTQAYEGILNEYKRSIEKTLDTIDTKQAQLIAKVAEYFDGLKQSVGSRSHLKSYINEWSTVVINHINTKFSAYVSNVSNIDGMLAGRVRVNYEPSLEVENHIDNSLRYAYFYDSGHEGDSNLFQVLKCTKVQIASSPKVSPEINKSLSSLSTADVLSALLTCLDNKEILLKSLQQIGFSLYNTISISAEDILKIGPLMKRLVTTCNVSMATTEPEKAKALVVKKETDTQQEYKDFLKDAFDHLDPNSNWEIKFVNDMKKFKAKSELSPKQLEWLSKIALRKTIPTTQSNPPTKPVALPGNPISNVSPTPSGKVSLMDFLELCKETMQVGREKGFIEDLLRKAKSWSVLSPGQQKWLKDIYVRGGHRKLPDTII